MTDNLQQFNFTGERMVPEVSESIAFWEHVYRYRFAARCVSGKRVLDIACGEGYGTAALSRAGVVSIVGVDISEEVVRHARVKYGIPAVVGSATEIPVPSKSIDVIVSFETIEHLDNPRRFLNECYRVLAPGGVMILSTPNAHLSKRHAPNPFHLSEMGLEEFLEVIRREESRIEIFSQHPQVVPWYSPYALLSPESIWNRPNRLGRLIDIGRKILTPELRHVGTEWARQNVVDAIVCKRPRFLEVINPFIVRKHHMWMQYEPRMYVVVVRT